MMYNWEAVTHTENSDDIARTNMALLLAEDIGVPELRNPVSRGTRADRKHVHPAIYALNKLFMLVIAGKNQSIPK